MSGGARGGGPERAGSILPGLLRARGLERALERARVIPEWEERVGTEIAGAASPTGFDRATLFVEVRSSAWMMELQMMERQLLSRLNEGRTAPFEKIVFRLAAGDSDRSSNGER